MEEAALKALKTVQELSPKALDELITRDVGNPMLGVFASLARAANPKADGDVIARQVHLMVMAWLMRREAQQ